MADTRNYEATATKAYNVTYCWVRKIVYADRKCGYQANFVSVTICASYNDKMADVQFVAASSVMTLVGEPLKLCT